jgi:tRNA nucleotidyltransferase (CCA-adding enzyme)
MAVIMPKEIILTHDNADFDAVASLLAAHKLYPEATPILPHHLGRNVAEFMTLYQNGLPFIGWKEFKPHGKVERIIVVDTQRIPEMRHIKRDAPVLIIDHHPYEGDQGAHVTFVGEEIGANATLLTEQIIAHGGIHLSSLEATLMLLGIYADTGSLTYGKTTPRDIRAAAWLVEQGGVLDTVRRFMSIPLNEAQRALLDQLTNHQQTRYIHGHSIVVCMASIDQTLDNINHVTHRLRDLLEPTGLIVLVKMPNRVQMVCRSTTDAVDMGGLAKFLGGGGHPRAAAASIVNRSLEDIETTIWEKLADFVQPIVTVADLMSYGVQTVNADQKIADLIGQLRRIGHEGFPVLSDGRVVGLLTRRDADRAMEHGLKEATVRDIMLSGAVTLSPEDSVSTLEQTMVNADWGQIPIVTPDNRLIGIVTRTDLIKHWAKIHPTNQPRYDQANDTLLMESLGADLARLIAQIAHIAQEQAMNLYIVGGIVRDMMLKRPNDDIDFVTEDSAIDFAEIVVKKFGGEMSSFRPFGTAKWIPSPKSAELLGVAFESLPHHIDFATARNEFYQHPTALPSVYSGSIKLDLHRRDFTINTMAIQLSPQTHLNRILDFYGGMNDLNNGVIRALHSLSFVDDPTRILRAIRFEQRLNFTIEGRTGELIATHREMLRRITGERVRNELTLLLREDLPERGIFALHERGLLVAIHPDLAFSESASADFITIRQADTAQFCTRMGLSPEAVLSTAPENIYWLVWMKHVSPQQVTAVCERLLFGQKLITQFRAIAEITHDGEELRNPNTLPSRIVARFDTIHDWALIALWVNGHPTTQAYIESYMTIWRHTQSVINGDTLLAMNIPTGKHYRDILGKLRDAKLDGITDSPESENAYLDQLLAEMGFKS